MFTTFRVVEFSIDFQSSQEYYNTWLKTKDSYATKKTATILHYL